jgi:hypothetical protein
MQEWNWYPYALSAADGLPPISVSVVSLVWCQKEMTEEMISRGGHGYINTKLHTIALHILYTEICKIVVVMHALHCMTCHIRPFNEGI